MKIKLKSASTIHMAASVLISGMKQKLMLSVGNWDS